MGIENPIHLLFLGGVALLVLGPKRLPEVARSLGRGLREFREAMGEGAGGVGGAHGERPTSGARMGAQVEGPPGNDAGAEMGAETDAQPGAPVDPGEPVRSGDAPDRRPL